LRRLLRDCGLMSREQLLTDEQWACIEPLLPSSKGKQSRPFRDHRQVLEGIAYRYRVGCAWRDVPKTYGPWQTLWKRHARFSRDGTWDRIHVHLLAEADAAQLIDWQLSVDSTISRVHQHGASLSREAVVDLPSYAGGPVELQETAGRAG
jgi:transposase